jgi:hypothetical protein
LNFAALMASSIDLEVFPRLRFRANHRNSRQFQLIRKESHREII